MISKDVNFNFAMGLHLEHILSGFFEELGVVSDLRMVVS